MGTKLGNLHVKGASPEQVSALLPGALVGRWSEGFVSAYHEDFQWGSVEREGRKLSRKLPQAVVLTAALFDDDVVSFEVYQAGKRLTGHLLNPYEDQNKPGNIKLFREVLDLPAEDEKRLRALWKKGDACEQLELTGALLGLPLWADREFLPEGQALRDADRVDAWLTQRPDPPKIKSVTKAEVIQELQGIRFDASSRTMRSSDFCQIFTFGELGIHRGKKESQLWVPAADGTLRCVVKTRIEDSSLRYFFSPQRVLVAEQRRHYEPIPDYPGAYQGKSDGTYIIFDSHKSLPLPFRVSKETCNGIIPTGDGGIWACFSSGEEYETFLRYTPEGKLAWEKTMGPCEYSIAMTQDRLYTRRSESGSDAYHFFCYDTEGTLCGEQVLPWNTELVALDQKGGLWLGEELGKTLVHLDRDLELLARSPVFGPSHNVLEVVGSPDGKTLLVTSFQEGLWVLDGETLSIRMGLSHKMLSGTPAIDGKDRFWVTVGNSTLEAYDSELHVVSRHRLKGCIMALQRGDGGVTAYTHDDGRGLFLVYHIA